MRLSNIRYTDDCETYQILGGEAVSIDLQSGDSVEVIDVEAVSYTHLTLPTKA